MGKLARFESATTGLVSCRRVTNEPCGDKEAATPDDYAVPVVGQISGSESVEAADPLEVKAITNDLLSFDGAPRFLGWQC